MFQRPSCVTDYTLGCFNKTKIERYPNRRVGQGQYLKMHIQPYTCSLNKNFPDVVYLTRILEKYAKRDLNNLGKRKAIQITLRSFQIMFASLL